MSFQNLLNTFHAEVISRIGSALAFSEAMSEVRLSVGNSIEMEEGSIGVSGVTATETTFSDDNSQVRMGWIRGEM